MTHPTDTLNGLMETVENHEAVIAEGARRNEKSSLSHYSMYKEAHKKYQDSDKGKAARSKYMNSAKGKLARARYQAKRRLREQLVSTALKSGLPYETTEQLEADVENALPESLKS